MDDFPEFGTPFTHWLDRLRAHSPGPRPLCLFLAGRDRHGTRPYPPFETTSSRDTAARRAPSQPQECDPNMTTKPTNHEHERPLKTGVPLNVYIGEHDVFVRVPRPDDKLEHTEQIRKFYRSVAILGKRPEDIWDSYLGYAVISMHIWRKIRPMFNVEILKKIDFIMGE